MQIRSDLPEFTKYTFGSMSLGRKAENLTRDISVARAAMDAGVWFHTSQEYGAGGTFMVLRHAFDEARSQTPKCIFKIRCDSAEHIRFEVTDAIARLGIDRVDVAQLCKDNHEKREIVDDFLAEGPMWRTCCELKEKGLVGNFVMEVFAQFSADAIRAVENDMFDGYILYYNLLDRHANNELFDLLESKKAPLLALRTMSSTLIYPEPARRFSETKGEPILERRDALEPILEQSSCTSWPELAMRFILSHPKVQTTIGGTTSIEHLNIYIDQAGEFKPLEQETIDQIRTLHRQWWA